jgi:uncharacterized membrane protein
MPDDVNVQPVVAASHAVPIATAAASSTGLSTRFAAALAYSAWWITGFLFWFLERRDRYVRFHAAQSLAAFGLIALLIGGFAVLAIASLSFLPNAFTLFVWAAAVTWTAGVALWVVAMWKAANGNVWRIPIASELADRMTRSGSVE